MLTTLKAIEKGNLYASFGLVEDLSDDELMDTEGGDPSAGHGYQSGTGCMGMGATIGGGGGGVSYCGGC